VEKGSKMSVFRFGLVGPNCKFNLFDWVKLFFKRRVLQQEREIG